MKESNIKKRLMKEKCWDVVMINGKKSKWNITLIKIQAIKSK